MWNLDATTWIWLLGAVQTAGLSCACAVRCYPPTRYPSVFCGLFYALLGLAGAANVVSLAVSASLWLASSAVLAVMVLVATIDLGGARRATC